MSTVLITRPESNESISYYHRYIDKVSEEDVGTQLIQQLREVEQLFEDVTDRDALARYAEGKWSIKEILGHLADTERIFSYRLLRVARGDATPLPGYDENAYVPAGQFDERPLPMLLGELRAVRLSTAALLEGLPEEAWGRWGEANGHPITARALAFIMVGHWAHHLGVLRERYGLGS
ncbi:MAG: DinB family protein [Geminicoccaceae bacterium]|nr:DinB family protein [Geminicoccaceae bacterium]